ncbi:hypothetical protein QBC44DRAFT_254227 [Cladorrhinum sp. PSN332]|nr:hypothetical protein QBC44DRAFT_254227 [Cladorrhinum sp. PSN332]
MSTEKPSHHPEEVAPAPEQDWETPLIQCTPCGPFWHAIACPCVGKSSLHGQTAQRLRDPRVEAEKNNADCKEFAVNQILFGLCFLEVMKSRRDIRLQYDIKGNGFGDFCVSCFCCSCALQQHDAELRRRQGRGEIGVVREGYVREEEMVMGVQRRE